MTAIWKIESAVFSYILLLQKKEKRKGIRFLLDQFLGLFRHHKFVMISYNHTRINFNSCCPQWQYKLIKLLSIHFDILIETSSTNWLQLFVGKEQSVACALACLLI